MKVYHMSDTLSLGASLSPDYKKNMALVEPFLLALKRGEDCFYATLYAAKYMGAALEKFGLKDMPTDDVKWSTEAAFEWLRQREFPDAPCRITSHYFFERLEDCRELFEIDWGQASAEERAKIHLFEMELEDEKPRRYDMRLFDEAYDDMWETGNLAHAMEAARRYFSGGATARPVWELVSGGKAAAVRDITEELSGTCVTRESHV